MAKISTQHIVILLLFSSFGCSENKRNEHIKFSHENWLRGNEEVRGTMIDNLISDSILIGKSKKEVLELLGDQGDTTGNFSYPVDLGLKTGPMGVGGVWPYELNIHFDSLTHKVIEVRCND